MTPVVVSCEHASASVPAAFRAHVRVPAAALAGHRGSDLGAPALARELARDLGVACHEARATRLLVDANRSIGHRSLFSEWSRDLPAALRERAVERYWRPHRDAVVADVERAIARADGAAVHHVSVHSFTPVLDGVERAIDVALLYDPSRRRERAFVDAWLGALAARRPDLRLRRNAPYRGVADGLTSALRRRFPARDYVGVELEVSQRFVRGDRAAWRRLRVDLRAAAARALGRGDLLQTARPAS